MKASTFCFVWIAFRLLGATGQLDTTKLRGTKIRQEALLCRIIAIAVSYDNENIFARESTTLEYECCPFEGGVESDKCYEIGIADALTEQHAKDLTDGNLVISIRGGQVVEGYVSIPENAVMEVSSAPHGAYSPPRRLSTTGTKTLLVVRVSSNDSEVGFSTAELNDLIFNDSDISTRSQMRSCSFGQLLLEPAYGGILDVDINMNTTGNDRGLVVAAATEAARQKLGMKLLYEAADLIILCIPPGTGGWVAAAAANNWKSVYNDRTCGYLSVSMHEIGHNLGLGHSSKNEYKYGDSTGYMGGSYAQIRGPQRCYNGQNNWYLGWYSEKALAVSPIEGPRLLKVAPFMYYNESPVGIFVIVKVGRSIYLQLNRDEGFNQGTGDMKNKLTVTQGLGGRTDLLAGLDMTVPSFRFDNFENSGQLLIEVCSTTDAADDEPFYMTISLGYDVSLCSSVNTRTVPTYELVGSQTGVINVPNFNPSVSATLTPPPTNQPTAPSPFPSNSPTEEPTATPSRRPSRANQPPLSASPASSPSNSQPTHLLTDSFLSSSSLSNQPTASILPPSASPAESPATPTLSPQSSQANQPPTSASTPPITNQPTVLSLLPSLLPTTLHTSFSVLPSAPPTNQPTEASLWPKPTLSPSFSPTNRPGYQDVFTVPDLIRVEAADDVRGTPDILLPSDNDDSKPPEHECQDSTRAILDFQKTIKSMQFVHNQTCDYLAGKVDLQAMYCLNGQTAYDLCPQTCGKCPGPNTPCDDNPLYSFTLYGKTRDCAWVGLNPTFNTCVEGSGISSNCRQACGYCNSKSQSSGNTVELEVSTTGEASAILESSKSIPVELGPNTPVEALKIPSGGGVQDTPACSDSSSSADKFLVSDENGMQSCEWLRLRPKWQLELCAKGRRAYELCPDTCGLCKKCTESYRVSGRGSIEACVEHALG